MKCHFVSLQCLLTGGHQHGEKLATPCSHICSCSDKNNTRPSQLHPYLGPYFTAGSHNSIKTDITQQRKLARHFVELLYYCDSRAVNFTQLQSDFSSVHFTTEADWCEEILVFSNLTLGLTHLCSRSFSTLRTATSQIKKKNYLRNSNSSIFPDNLPSAGNLMISSWL